MVGGLVLLFMFFFVVVVVVFFFPESVFAICQSCVKPPTLPPEQLISLAFLTASPFPVDLR